MLRDGPIPVVLHGGLEYLAGAAFIVLPLLLDFKSDAATAASIVAGVVILVVAATTSAPTGIIRQIPVSAHLVLDFIIVAALIAAPFLFDFSGEAEPTVLFMGIGVVHLLVTIGTRFVRREPETGPA